MALRHEDLAKALAHTISRKGKFRRAGLILARAHLASPAGEAEVSAGYRDCFQEYVDGFAECENAYTNALGDADDAFAECIRSANSYADALACIDQYEFAIDNAILAFDGCQAAIAAKYIECLGPA